MSKAPHKLRRGLIGLVVLLQIFFYPAVTLTPLVTAQEAPVAAEPEPCPTYPGTQAPTGSGSHTFTFDPETCVWKNQYYTWDPASKTYSPRYDNTPYYNAEKHSMDHVNWVYSPAAGSYIKRIVSVPIADETSAQTPTENVSQPQTNTGSSEDSPQSQSTQQASSTATSPGSNTTVDSDTSLDADLDYSTDVDILTNTNSTATSGNASVLQNTNAGDATTGDAEALLNLINLFQSTWDPSMGELATFNANIDNDLYGDIVINPNNLGPNSNVSVDNQVNKDIDVNISNDTEIENNVNVQATSGDAKVIGNTNAGSATTGDAQAIVNVLNFINSAIASNKSFLGVLNINGSFNGDILLPEGMLDTLLTMSGPNSTTTVNNEVDTDIDISATNNTAIANNVNTSATSGNATVSGNTTAGNATTGDASTNVTLLNMTGKDVVAENALLVFVNVLGSWVGLIMDAPAGTTSAALGGNVSSNNSITTDIDAELTTNTNITNNINASAASGDATVARNTNAGDATTGNASTAVNVGNITNSQLNLSSWFGVLFINVFGDWVGSFGVDTEAGETAQNNPPRNQPQASAQSSASSGGSTAVPQVFSFIASAATNSGQSTGQAQSEQSQDAQPQVAAASTQAPENQNNDVPTSFAETSATAPGSDWFNQLLVTGAIIFAALGALRIRNIFIGS